MLQAYQNLLEAPGRVTYLAARRCLLRELCEVPSAGDLAVLSNRIAERDFAAVAPLADAMAPLWLLSPRFHFLLGTAAEHLGDLEQVALSHLEFSSCLQGILDTGRGAPTAPYIVTYASDVLDVLDVQADAVGDGPWQFRRRGPLDIVAVPGGRTYHFHLPRPKGGIRSLVSELRRQRLRPIPLRVP